MNREDKNYSLYSGMPEGEGQGEGGMTYLSVCSGIEAATVAWEGLGWVPAAFSEIEPFPSAVLDHHFPRIPNLGDMTKYKEWNLARKPNLLVGGTPCQSFSVAGLRKGLDDPRGNLMLTFGAIADHLKVRWIVWENVPGVLSSNRGRDFGSFLALLGLLGYGFAYRVLDAQHFGVPQRRRRVFVVGHLGDWRPAAAVLFESESLLGNPAARGAKREVTPTIPASGAGTGRTGNERTKADFLVMAHGQANAEISADGSSPALTCNHEAPILAAPLGAGDGNRGWRNDLDQGAFIVTHTLRGEGFDASEDGTGRGIPLVVNARQDPDVSEVAPPMGRKDTGHALFSIMPMNSGKDYKAREVEVAQPIMAGEPVGGNQGGDLVMVIPFDETQITHPENRSRPEAGDPSPTLAKGARPPSIAAGSIRRLTPRECERLQGFPDDWTRIPWKGKPAEACPDGPRYKACGNSMAVPVMAWIGKRIHAMQETLDGLQ
jgi:DNA (cytosine-5)-methyltransferase 1